MFSGDEDSLDTSFSSMPSLCQSKAKTFEDLDTNEALERICGSASLESLPGFRPMIISPSGMVSNKMSITTIFGHKILSQKWYFLREIFI